MGPQCFTDALSCIIMHFIRKVEDQMIYYSYNPKNLLTFQENKIISNPENTFHLHQWQWRNGHI